MRLMLILLFVIPVAFGCKKEPTRANDEVRLKAEEISKSVARARLNAEAVAKAQVATETKPKNVAKSQTKVPSERAEIRELNESIVTSYERAVDTNDSDKAAMLAAFVRMTNAANSGDMETFREQGKIYEHYRLKVKNR